MNFASNIVNLHFHENPGSLPENLIGSLSFVYMHKVDPTVGARQRLEFNHKTEKTRAVAPVELYIGSVNTLEDAMLTILHEYGHSSSDAISERKGSILQTSRAERAADRYAKGVKNEIFK